MKIEKCPFCGCKAILCSTGNHFATEKFFVSCGVCGVETPRIARTRKEAIAAWNRRTQPENKPLTTSELRKMDGEPVYIVDEDLWGIIKCDLVGRWAGMPFAVGHYSGVNFEWDIKKRGLVCCRSKPKEEHHEDD